MTKKIVFALSLMIWILPLQAQTYRFEFDGQSGGFLGVQLREVNSDDVDQLRLPAESGAVIESVEAGTPAEEAGLQADDVVVAVAGLPILSAGQLQRVVRENPAGRTLPVTLYRAGRRLEVNVKLGERPKGPGASFHPFEFKDGLPQFRFRGEGLRDLPSLEMFRGLDPGGRARLGVSVSDLNEGLARALGLRSGQGGVLVLNVTEDSPASRAGLQAGDVIAKVDGVSIEGVEELREKIQDDSVQLEIIREQRQLTLQVEFEKKAKGTRF